LLCHHGLLHAGEQRLAFGQREAKGLIRQFLALKGGHLGHDGGSIPLLDYHLHDKLHAHASDPDTCPQFCRNCRLMTRRSQRLTAAQYWSVRSSS